MLSEVVHQGRRLALILSHRFDQAGLHFFTPDECSQQLAYMHYPGGKVIQPHLHNPVPRQVEFTMEVLFIKKGRVRVDFFDEGQNYLESRVLETSDTILLMEGGHGFESLEELEMIEVKQGPFAGDRDKVKFHARLPEKLKFGTDS